MFERDLRKPLKANLFESAGICSLTWQGDFGTGQSTGSGVWSEIGANPCVLNRVSTATGIPQPQFRLGMVVQGDLGAEFVYGKLVLAALTDLLPGQAYQLDENYVATLLSTATSVLNTEAVILNVFTVQAAVGTYYGWFQRAGRAAVQAAAASIATGQAETTATAGTLKFLASGGHTAGTKSTDGLTAFGASSSITFTGTTVNGSPYITLVTSAVTGAGGGVADLAPGMTITGTGLPANACIAAIDKAGGQWRVTIGTATAANYNVQQNATANGSGVTFTVTTHVAANLQRPVLKTAN